MFLQVGKQVHRGAAGTGRAASTLGQPGVRPHRGIDRDRDADAGSAGGRHLVENNTTAEICVKKNHNNIHILSHKF